MCHAPTAIVAGVTAPFAVSATVWPARTDGLAGAIVIGVSVHGQAIGRRERGGDEGQHQLAVERFHWSPLLRVPERRSGRT